MQGRFILDDVDAVDLAVELVVLDGILYLREAEYRQVGTQLAVAYDVLAGRVHVHAVRRLRTWDEVKEVVVFPGINHLHLVQDFGSGLLGVFVHHVVRILTGLPVEVALCCVFRSLLPVDGEDVVLVVVRSVDLQKGVGLLGVVAGEERPVGRGILAAVAQVVVERRQSQLEVQTETAGVFIYLYIRNVSAELLLVVLDGHVTVLVVGRDAEAGTCHDVLCVAGDERRSMVAARIRQFDNFCRTEALEVDACNTRCVVGIDEQPAAVVHGVGLGKLCMVRVVPWYESEGCVQHGLGILIIAIAVFTVL